MQLLKECDFLSSEVYFTFNSKGDKRLKTIFGGFICLLCIGCSFGFSLYLLIQLFLKENSTVISSSTFNKFVNLTNGHKLPFMVRLTDGYNVPYKDPEKIYGLAFSFWSGGSNTTDENVEQTRTEIKLEKCDLEKHFSDFKSMFDSTSDLDTFYCPVVRSYDMGIYGTYASVDPFGYYHMYVYMCKQTEEENKCLPEEEIDQILSNTYLDFRTVDYSINNFNNSEIRVAYIKSERFMLSKTVYKRIWMYFNQVEYITDDGLIFPSEHKSYFHQYDSMRSDIDNRNISVGTIPGTFTTITILATGNVIKYYRKYVKMQDCIATMGGVVKFFSVLGIIINYFYSQNSLYLFLITKFHSVCELTENEKKQIKNYRKKVRLLSTIREYKKHDINQTSNSFNITKNTININEKNSFYYGRQMEKDLINEFRKLIFPQIFCGKKIKFYKEVFHFYREHINTKLNIINVLKKLEGKCKREVTGKSNMLDKISDYVENYKQKKGGKKFDNLVNSTYNNHDPENLGQLHSSLHCRLQTENIE